MVPEAFRVVAKRRDTVDSWTLELEPCDGEPLAFEPGQFTMLSAGAAGEVPISISGDADAPGRLVHTVRSVGPATSAICRSETGDVLGVRGPFGRPWPIGLAEGGDVIIAAGGIGLPPLRPAVLRILAHRERYGSVTLLYGGRAPGQLMYPDELRAWSAAGVEVLTTVDSAGPEWLGHVGVVTRLVRRIAIDGPRTHAFCCGPEIMMRFTVDALAQAGVSRDQIFASIERNMQCGIGHCGHCQLGPTLVCRDGPVYRWSEIGRWLRIREL
jgi:NAD(P)H-flavin reductase